MMDTTTTFVRDDKFVLPTWQASSPYVRKALKFIQRSKGITVDELVAWDDAHGRKLFEWNDEEAAVKWRQEQARLFLNRFRARFDGMRIRAFIHVREDPALGIDRSEYVTVQDIAQHSGMREQVIKDITKRMRVLASELRMWQLDESEQAELFARLAEALSR